MSRPLFSHLVFLSMAAMISNLFTLSERTGLFDLRAMNTNYNGR